VIDILFLAHNRLEFTRASFQALLSNTDWSLVNRLCVYDDRSVDGTCKYLLSALKGMALKWYFTQRIEALESPVAVMADFLRRYVDSYFDAPLFAKIDSDVIVPPGWLDQCAATFEACPKLDLLGIEPPDSRCPHFSQPFRPQLTRDVEMAPGPPFWIAQSREQTIGGIGVFRRRAFEGRPLAPDGRYGGFEAWQLRHPEVTRGWIKPSLSLFLLDRLPMEPWASLSAEYIAQGWQRPWRTYSESVSHLWQWWESQRACSAS
jgi:hypothetical protein